MIGIALLASALTLLYLYVKYKFNYWQRKGFPVANASLPFGALTPIIRGKSSFGLAMYDVYLAAKEPIVGIYLSIRPALLVRDAELAHDMLTRDFASFHDRGIYVDEENNSMSANLFAQKGQTWKTLRNKLSPTFSSGKLKAMFGTAENIANKMMAHLNAQIPDDSSVEVDMKSIMGTYAIDIIGSVLFGLDVDSFAEPNNEFYTISRYINRPNLKDVVRGTTTFLYPELEKIFIKLGWTEEGPEMMRDLVKRTIAHREQHNIVRRDLLQLLLQLRNTGEISSDDNVWSAETAAGSLKTISKDIIAANLFVFFAAGYETSASTAAFTLHELAQNPEILAKVTEDVRKNLKAHNGEFSYDALQDMKYLELCIMETTRKYPPLPILNRECTQDYVVPSTKQFIKKGTAIVISLFGIHRDEQYFPDPMRYQPERFLEETKNYNPNAYMPFGDGPRHCIAARMGKLNVKIALAKIISNYNIEINTDRREIKFTKYGIGILSEGGVPVRLSKMALKD